MSRKRGLTSRTQFLAVYKSGRTLGDELLWLRSLPNGLDQSRYGFSVTKGIGKAVRRNRVRRLLRELIRVKRFKPGWDVVFIPRPNIVTANYHQIEESVDRLLARAHLLEGKDGENGSAVN